MLRVHFTGEDLLRTRLARGPDCLWEVVLGANLLGNRDGQGVFDNWRRQTHQRLHRLPPEHLRLIRHLAPPRGDFPDFLTPVGGTEDLAAGIETVLSTPTARLRTDMSVLRSRPSWLRPVYEGEPAALRTLGEALQTFYTEAVEPVWERIQAVVDADRALRARALLEGGLDGLLNSFRPAMRWSRPVLEVDYPVDRDLHLDGRGLLLIPSAFCWRTSVTLIDPALTPVLVYPAPRASRWWTHGRSDRDSQSLERLLGAGRASALRCVEDGCTTGELARRTVLNQSVASRHATALREADLITTRRMGNKVLHVLTPLGRALLDANPPPRDGSRRTGPRDSRGPGGGSGAGAMGRQ